MKKWLICILPLLAAEQGLAEHDEGFYSGAALGRWQYDQLGLSENTRLESLEFNAGFWFHPLLSAEVRAGIGLGDRAADISGTSWELGIDYFGSIYWRPEVGNDVAKLYGLFGYSTVELSADTGIGTGTPQSIDLSDDGPSFGAGVGFFYNEDITLNLEWRQLIDADGFEIKGYSAGFDYRF